MSARATEQQQNIAQLLIVLFESVKSSYRDCPLELVGINILQYYHQHYCQIACDHNHIIHKVVFAIFKSIDTNLLYWTLIPSSIGSDNSTYTKNERIVSYNMNWEQDRIIDEFC